MGLGEVFKLFATLGIDATEFDKALSQAEQRLSGAEQTLTGAGRTLTKGVTAPIVGLGTAALHSSITFESAFAGVRKTVDATEEEFAELEEGIRSMATRLPASAEEIARVAEAAGQLGIQTGNILGFTETMIGLGESTNMSSDEAATALARFANIVQMPQDQFDRLGSTIVDLGNNLATTEAEIVEMGLRLAGAGNTIGLTEAEILGFAGALSSVGIMAEAGGTAFSRVMLNMMAATQQGGDELEGFATVAGMTTDEFVQAFQTDPVSAIEAFVGGLQRIQAEGGDLIGALKSVKLSEIRVRDALLRLAGAGDVMTNSVNLATAAWDENTALQVEVGRRYETTESQLAIFRNSLQEVVRTLGDALVPLLMAAVEAAKPFVAALQGLAEWFGNLNPAMQGVIVTGAGVAAAIGPILWLAGSFMGAIKNLLPLLRAVGPAFTAIRTALGLLTGPVGWIITAIGLIATAWATDFLGIRTTVTENWDKVVAVFQGAWERVKSIGQGIVDGFRSAWDTVSGVFTGARDTMQRNLDWVMDDVRVFGMGIKDLIAGDWRGAWVHAAELVDNFTTAIEDTWPGFAWWIRDRFKDLTDVVHSAGTAIEAVFRGDWDAALTAGREMLTNWWQGLDNLLGGMPGRLIEHGKTAIAGLVDGFRERFPGVVTFTEDLLDNMRVTGMALGDLARGDWRGALTHVEQLFDWFTTSIENRFPGFTNWLRDRFNDIVGFARTGGETLEALFRGRWSDAFQGLKDLAGQWWDGLNSLLGGIPRRILDWGVEVATAFRDWWDRSWEFLSGLPSRMLEFGKNLITGLIDGVKSMVTGAVEAVKGVGENVINGFKSLLGIESPSKVFYGFGVDIGEGLAQGIESTEGRVMEATAKLAEGVTSTFGSRTIGRVDPGAWVRAITDGLEGRDAVIALERALRELESQRAATFRHRFAGTAGQLARQVIDFKASVLEEELQRLREEIRRLRVQQARDTEVQTRRFSMAVGTFAQGVQGLQLARQRY